MGEWGGERWRDIAQTIGLNCGMTHCPGKIEYNCRCFLMIFRKLIRKNKFSKNDFHTLQGTMSHRPLTNTSSLKITAAYCTYYSITVSLRGLLGSKWAGLYNLKTGKRDRLGGNKIYGEIIFAHKSLWELINWMRCEDNSAPRKSVTDATPYS